MAQFAKDFDACRTLFYDVRNCDARSICNENSLLAIKELVNNNIALE
jgi:hypothetical protein